METEAMTLGKTIPLAENNLLPALPKSHRHLPQLDGIRGIAILSVLVCHLFWVDTSNGPIANAVFRVLAAGWVGVDLFFVLSGFLITGILIKSREEPNYFLNFYARRAVRIFPLYYGLLAAGLLAAHVHSSWALWKPDDQFLGHQWWLWTYMDNLRCVLTGKWFGYHAGPFVYGHFWSLAVEEHYYLVWPLVVLLCPPKRLLPVALGLAAMSAIARDIFVLHGGNMIGAYCFTPFRCDGLLIGAACAILVRRPAFVAGLQMRQRWFFIVAVLLLVSVYPSTAWDHDNRFVGTIGYSLLAVIFGIFIMLAATAATDSAIYKLTDLAVLRGLGRYSYGIYALHMVVLEVVDVRLTDSLRHHGMHSILLSSSVAKFAGLLASVGLAMLSFHLYEKPFLRLKRYFGPARAKVTTLQSMETAALGS